MKFIISLYWVARKYTQIIKVLSEPDVLFQHKYMLVHIEIKVKGNNYFWFLTSLRKVFNPYIEIYLSLKKSKSI